MTSCWFFGTWSLWLGDH